MIIGGSRNAKKRDRSAKEALELAMGSDCVNPELQAEVLMSQGVTSKMAMEHLKKLVEKVASRPLGGY